MFAMYDDDGLNFRSTIDHLYKVHELAASQNIKNSIKDNKDHQNFKDKLYEGKINQEAKEKYKQTANLDMRTEIFHVEQIMSHKPIIINSNEKTIKECFEIMQDKGIQQLLIREDNENHLKGMISKDDILNYLISSVETQNNVLKTITSQISRKNIITTDPISDIRRVAQVMIDFNLNAIPVVDSNDVILGVVSRHNMVNALASIPHLQVWA